MSKISSPHNHFMLNATVKDKFICTLSYLSFGIVGFVVFLLNLTQNHFTKYHVFQSVFIGILYFLTKQAIHIFARLIGIIHRIPLFQTNEDLFAPFAILLKGLVIIDQLLVYLVLGILAYCIFTLWQNKYSWIKYISAQIYKMI